MSSPSANSASPEPRTVLSFQHDAKLYHLSTVVTAVTPFGALSEPSQLLFKSGTEHDWVVATQATIFHPQGGGQPSDTGSMTSARTGATFAVTAVRMDSVHAGQVLHLGRFADASEPFSVGDAVRQAVDVDQRLLYSRYHTAGHVLGAAVRHLLQEQVANFDELKASHVPDSAACEFQGLIEGKWKDGIQAQVDAYVAQGMPVEIDFWSEADFRAHGLERLIPREYGGKLPAGEKYRVVKIVGAEVYPCGGTHVDSTDLCGHVGVKKISRSKGTSRVSYLVR